MTSFYFIGVAQVHQAPGLEHVLGVDEAFSVPLEELVVLALFFFEFMPGMLQLSSSFVLSEFEDFDSILHVSHHLFILQLHGLFLVC